jgi:hypothetical protein
MRIRRFMASWSSCRSHRIWISGIVLDCVSPAKDVDAFAPENVGLISRGRPRYSPCTPHGVLQLLHRCGIPLSGVEVVVVGRSDIVGKPLRQHVPAVGRAWWAKQCQRDRYLLSQPNAKPGRSHSSSRCFDRRDGPSSCDHCRHGQAGSRRD